MTKNDVKQKIKELDLRVTNLKVMQQKYDSLKMRDAAIRTNDRINEVLDERDKLQKHLDTFNFGVDSWLE